MKSQTSSKFVQIRLRTAEIAALQSLEKYPETYNVKNLVTSLAPSFFKSCR